MKKRGRCRVCKREFLITADDLVRHHSGGQIDLMGHRAYRCKGAGDLPIPGSVRVVGA